MNSIGAKNWAIADGYIPAYSHGKLPEMRSHEAVCILNASDQDAQVELTLFFSDREPAGPYRLQVHARRTLHQRMTELTIPERVPVDTDYAILVSSNVEIIVQQTRLDSRQAENGLFSTIAFPIN